MSREKALLTSATLTFGFTFLLTAGGPGGALAAMYFGFIASGLVGALVLASYDTSRTWWPRRSYYAFWDDDFTFYRPSFFSWRRPMPYTSTVPASSVSHSATFVPAGPTYLPSHHAHPASVPASATLTGTHFVPAAKPSAPPPSVGSGAHHVNRQFFAAGTPHHTHHGASTSSGSAMHMGSSFRPAPVPPSHAPAPGATHVGRHFVPK